MSKRRKKNLNKPIAYYIEGNSERGYDVIKALKDVGGRNDANLNGEGNVYYFIDVKTKIIDIVPKDCSLANMLNLYGVKLTLKNKYYVTDDDQFKKPYQRVSFNIHNTYISSKVGVYIRLLDSYFEWLSYFDRDKYIETIDVFNKLGFKFPSKDIAEEFYEAFKSDVDSFNVGTLYDEKV